MAEEVAIIGAGPAGMFAAYSYAKAGARVTVFDRGVSIPNRTCPNVNCKECGVKHRCSILNGEGGAGGFSDGKVTLSTGRGVQNSDVLDFHKRGGSIHRLASLCRKYGPQSKYYEAIDRPEILEKSKFEFESYPLEFYGTDGIQEMFMNMRRDLEDNYGVIFNFLADVVNLESFADSVVLTVKFTDDKKSISYEFFRLAYDRVVIAVGAYNKMHWIRWANQLGIPLDWFGPAGIGIRLETDFDILDPLMSKFYDFKLYLNSVVEHKVTQFRSFCVNGGGSIVNENHGNFVSINGRSESENTGRSNLAIIAKIVTPNAKDYVRAVTSNLNTAGDGLPLVDLAKNFVSELKIEDYLPDSSKVWHIKNKTYGPIAQCMPPDLARGFINYLLELETILPGAVSHSKSLVYAPEIKYHLPQFPVDEFYHIDNLPRIQIIGDAAGYTASFSTAAVMGLRVADTF